jgi:uncharacterized membrane protein YheB (UPF0754 family)
MRKIAVVRVFWFNEYCREGYVSSSHPVLQEIGQDWKEVSEEEFQEITSFIKTTRNYCDDAPAYVIVEKIEEEAFQQKFDKYKEKIRKEMLTEEQLVEKNEKLKKQRDEKKKQKQIEKAKEFLKEVGELK